MKTTLSLLLSFCILFSSVSPSLAQTLPVKAGKGIAKQGKVVGKIVQKGVAVPKVKLPANAQVYSAGKRVGQMVPTLPSVTVVPNGSYLQVPSALISSKLTDLTSHHALSVGELTDGLPGPIFAQTSPLARAAALRSLFVTFYLHGNANLAQQAEAVKFYRTELEALSGSFAKLPKGDERSALLIASNKSHASYKDVLDCNHALSDAAALGLVGTKADAPALINFYKKAVNSPFEKTAEVIAARGLLRQGAYDQLQELATLTGAKGPFWQDLSAVVQEKGLPVQINAVAGEAAPASSDMARFLKLGCPQNVLNADISRKATQDWLELGASAPAAAPVAVKAPAAAPAARQVEMPKVQLVGSDLVLSPTAVPTEGEVVTETTPAVTESKGSVEFLGRSDENNNSGILYSGVPVFAIGKLFKKGAAWIKNRFNKKAPEPIYHEPGLHDATQISEVYSNLRSPEAPASADELMGAGEEGPVPVSEKGFKLTRVDEKGIERILPVNLEISNRFRVKGYNRVAFALTPNFKHGYVAELRNQTQPPLRMAHFYMRLQADQVGSLVDLVRAAGMTKFSLKLETRPDVVYQATTQQVTDAATGALLPLEVTLPEKSVAHGEKVVLLPEGNLALQGTDGKIHNLSRFYVRLPKNQIGKFVQILRQSPTKFNVSVHPTQNRADLIVRDASLTNVSLGKTMGPVVNGALDMDVSAANGMMFGINYVLPGLASLLTPVLKKYGEKNLMVLSLAMSTAAGALATAGGFYGFVEGMALSPVQKGLFITALFLMSGSSILKQLVSNLLIRANRGEVILNAAKDALKTAETEMTVAEKQGFAKMGERVKEFFTKKSEVSLKDIVLYNLSFVYKNVGTLAFLASPYLINHGIQLATGVDLGLDYSISFPIYAGYSGWVAWKVWRAKLRDAYSAKNLEQSQKMLQGTLDAGAKVLGEAKGEVSSLMIDDVARGFKDSLDAWVFANVKMDSSKKSGDLYKGAKKELFAGLEKQLSEQYNIPADRMNSLVHKVKHSVAVQENTIGNMGKMLKAPGVAALASAMTLATIHEFVISSSFATSMKSLISQGEFANFLIACSLYLPFIVGRLGGNVVSRRISPDTMYILCSGLSALGTGIMATAGDSVTQTIAGAAVASLGVGNFFTQMYDYIMNRYPKQNRELSSILALTMAIGGLGAIPAGYFASMGGVGVPMDLLYAGTMLGASLLLTPGMMRNSSLVKGMKYEAGRLWKKVKGVFKRGDKGATPTGLDNAAPAN
ncbi:MFS transporter [Candidatus Avelusimicrobium stercoris]|uniref:MFS transporter n=1 Tax=Candidatus Avelusimicrobium stercoris TaxID=1947924 RepID=UPI003D12AF03